MALSTQGTAHLYGIQGGVSVIANATVLSFTKSDAKANVSETQNEIGNTIEWRGDDEQADATLTLRPRTLFTAFVPGDKLTYETVDYVVISRAVDEQNAGFVTHTYTLKAYEYITEA